MQVLYALEKLRTPFLDGLFCALTTLGEEAVVVVVFCVLYWCIDKRLAYRVATGYFASGLLIQSMKVSFRIDRPWVLAPDFNAVQGALAHATGYSFPSGHTNSATALYGSFAFAAKRTWQRAVCCALIAVVAFSRMYLGVHTPLDVGVSFALTLLVCAAVFFCFQHFEGRGGFDAWVAAALLVLAAAAFVLARTLWARGLIELSYVTDCFKTVGAVVGFAAGFYIERRWIGFSVKCRRGWMQIVKCLAGVAGLLLFKEGLKPLLGASPVMAALRYFLVILWATVLFPLLIRRFFAPKTDEDRA